MSGGCVATYDIFGSVLVIYCIVTMLCFLMLFYDGFIIYDIMFVLIDHLAIVDLL